MSAMGGFLRWLGTMLFALLVSLFAGGMVCFMLGIAFHADLELLAAFGLMSFAALLTSAVLVAVALTARRARALAIAAVLIVAASALGFLAIIVGQALQDGDRASVTRDLPLFAETVLPIAVMALVQWWFVRRRWNKERSA